MACQVEKETRAAISQSAVPSSVEQLKRLATLMQDLADRTSSKPATKKAASQARAKQKAGS